MFVMDILALIGATIILTWSPLFGFFHRLYPKFFECAMCTGFWIGLMGSFVRRADHMPLLDHLFSGFAVSLLAFATSLILERIQLPLLKDKDK